jgi:hypothetical protein
MATLRGHVEGKKKLAAWLAFEKFRREWRHIDADEEIYGPGVFLLFPRTKKEAFHRMRKKEDDSGWILEYCFTT